MNSLFKQIKNIEKELGRKESFRWGPREIDLDILFYNNLVYSDEQVKIPHPGITERNFVLVPLNEIDPDFVHPKINKKIIDIIAHTENQKSIKKLAMKL